MNKIIANRSLDLLKHEKVKEKYRQNFIQNTFSDFNSEPFIKKDFNELVADVNMAIADLPPQMRTIFALSRQKGLKYAEIAVQLHISVKTVQTQMNRALIKLRSKLNKHLSFYLIITLINFFKKYFF